MSLAGQFVDESSRLGDPVVLKIPPVTTHPVAMYRADVIVSAQLGAGEPLQDHAESPGRDIEVARLKPDAIGIRNPATIVFQIDVGDEMFRLLRLGSRPSVKLLKEVIGNVFLCVENGNKPGSI